MGVDGAFAIEDDNWRVMTQFTIISPQVVTECRKLSPLLPWAIVENFPLTFTESFEGLFDQSRLVYYLLTFSLSHKFFATV